MSFKGMSYLKLWQHLCSVDWNHLCNIVRRDHEEQSREIILNLARLCNFERGHHGEHPCEVI